MTTRTTYPSYKSSGVDWLGDIPSHWTSQRLKSVAHLHRGYDLADHQREPGDVPVVSSGGITGYHSKALAHAPGVVMGRTGSTENLFYVEADYWPHNTSLYVDDFHGNNPRFIYWLLTTLNVTAHSTKSAVPGVDRKDLHEIAVTLPPLDEQRTIADYLDRKDAEITRFIASRRRMIALLEEKKQAIINQAVTRGLDSSVPMKDSGVEWLGEIPTHWEVRKLAKATHQIKPGPFGSHLSQSSLVPIGRKVYTQGNVIKRNFKAGHQYVNDDTWLQLRAFVVLPGDLLVSARGTIGKSFILPEEAPPGLLHPSLIKVKCNEKVLLPRYLSTLIEWAANLRHYFLLMSNATTIDVIYAGTLSASRIPVPPTTVQNEICQYVDVVDSQLTRLQNRIVAQIDLVQEYRTRLTSDVVTGKVSVVGSLLSDSKGDL